MPTSAGSAKSAAKSAPKSAAKSAEKSAPKSAAKSAEKSAPKSAARSAPKTAAAAKSGSRPGSRKSSSSAAKDAVDPTLRPMTDPWFTLVCAGAKTVDVRFADPPPVSNGQPPRPSLFGDIQKGDILTWHNSKLGRPAFKRFCKVQVTGVNQTSTLALEAKLTPYLARMYPTLKSYDEARAVMGAMGKTDEDKRLVMFTFKRIAA